MSKIKNIVFDIGKVLMEWDPEGIYRTLFNRDDYNKHPISSMPGGMTWLEFDRGTIGLDDAIDIFSRNNEDHHDDIGKFLKEAPYHIPPMWDSVDCAMKYKNLGYRIYLLSNFPEYGFKIIQNKFSFFDKFHGGVISWEVNAIKPEKKIYEILIEKYNLNPGETIFIDDVAANIKSAEDLGIKGLHFLDGMNLHQELAKIIPITI